MLVSDVRPMQHLAGMELSDFKEAITLRDVWKSALITSGGQCVMIFGALLMLKLSADSLDSPPVVNHELAD